MYLRYFIIILLGLVAYTMDAQEGMIRCETAHLLQKNTEAGYYIDTSGTLELGDVKKLGPDVFKQSKGMLNLGILSKPVWLKFRVENKDPQNTVYIFYINYALLDTVMVYQNTDSRNMYTMQQGEHTLSYLRFYDTKNIVFPLKLQYGEPQDVYVQIKTHGAVYLPLMLSTQWQLFDYEKKKYIYYGLFYGAILVVLIYNFFLFFSIKDPIYFLYNCYIIVVIGAISMLNGFMSYLSVFDGYRSLLNPIFAELSLLTHIIGCLFCYQFLEIYKKKSWSNYVLRGFMFLGIFTLLLSFFVPYKVTGNIASFLFILSPFFILSISIHSWIKGNKIARFYIFASSFFSISVFITCLRVLGIIKGGDAQEFILEIGVIIDTIFISLALADKLRKLNSERINAQENEKLAIEDKEMIIVEHNNILEDRIGLRTREILEKNHQLEFYAQKIAQQNQLLQEHNINLERQIEERTSEISASNHHLEKKTARLEQFTYIVSHNLRSPVRNIDTLLNFVDQITLDMATQEYFNILQKTNDQLKNIISDMSILISQDVGHEIELNQVELPTIINNIKDKLIIQILESNCNIRTDFEIGSILSFSPYMSSILYNLISNAIKYRSPERSIDVLIKTYVKGYHFVIEVQDNGRGIDTDKLEHICKLFYKIDQEEEGRGMGLFIVKSQVEQLDGKLFIESTLNLGTTFTIVFPLKNKG